MARKASGEKELEAARERVRQAKTMEELRAAQAVLLPLELGLNMKQTALAIGRSVSATCALRTRYIQVLNGSRQAGRGNRGMRNHAKASLEREAEVLNEVLSEAATGGVVVIPPLKPLVEAKLGKSIALSTLYNMLARHGWRKLAPRKRHHKADATIQEDWKKNSPLGLQRR
jgi:winged helix-turn-helix protein